MKPLLLFICFTWLIQSSKAQFIIQSGAQLKTKGAVHLVFKNINVINNDSLTDLSSASILFEGNNNSFIAGSGSWKVKKLVVDKASATLSLKAPLFITEQVALSGGLLDLNNQELTLSAGATLEGENEMARITGASGGYIQTTVH